MPIILAVGSQNRLRIKQGVRREGGTAVVLVMALSMGVFYVVGALGVGALPQNVPWLPPILKWGGGDLPGRLRHSFPEGRAQAGR